MALWDKDHGDQNMFCLDPGRKQWLEGKVTTLQQIVQPDQLWPHLITLDVLDNGKKGAIKLNHTDEQQVEGLCHHLQKSPVWAWHAFLRSLVLTHQEAVVNALGIDPKSYKDAAPVVGPPPSVMPLPPGLSNTAPVVAPPAAVMSPPSGLSAGPTPPVASGQAREMLQRMAESMKREIVQNQPKLIGPEGLGPLTGNEEFIAYIRALQVIQEGDIDQINAKPTTAGKTSTLIGYLRPCSQMQLSMFAWILVKLGKEYLLPTSITRDVKQLLRPINEESVASKIRDIFD